MIAKVVVLYLAVHNCDTGAILHQSVRQMPEFSISGDRLEDCRRLGVQQAERWTAKFRLKYPNASTNVVCKWERRRERA